MEHTKGCTYSNYANHFQISSYKILYAQKIKEKFPFPYLKENLQSWTSMTAKRLRHFAESQNEWSLTDDVLLYYHGHITAGITWSTRVSAQFWTNSSSAFWQRFCQMLLALRALCMSWHVHVLWTCATCKPSWIHPSLTSVRHSQKHLVLGKSETSVDFKQKQVFMLSCI